MIQFKEKRTASTRCSLFTYPVLMAADILLYRPAHVPVGDDQRQHVELTRDLALRFNATYGEVFTVPELSVPPRAARVMDLTDPTRKMSKSADAAGSVFLLDPPDVVRRKVARAVTDSEIGAGAVRADRSAKPGVTNLVEILVACGGSADDITTYGALKAAVTEAWWSGWRRSGRATPSSPPTRPSSTGSTPPARNGVARSLHRCSPPLERRWACEPARAHGVQTQASSTGP